jgi:alanine racemase
MTDKRLRAIIDLDAIAGNVRVTRSSVNPNTKIMAVVKADGYGHGAIKIAKTALRNGADQLGVAIFEEGFELRRANIDAPILVLGYTPPALVESAVKLDLGHTIFDYDTACALSRAARNAGTTARVHIKLDTGMTRLGFPTGDEEREKTLRQVCAIANLSGIFIEGVYTHFALSDGPDMSYTNRQFEQFMNMIKLLEEAGVNAPVRHCANSAAVIADSKFHLDMVRLGVAMYGLEPSVHRPARGLGYAPAMSLLATVSFVKRVPPGVAVSYGCKYVTRHESMLATITAGYADGYRRALSNAGRVLIRGQYAPVAGTVCMDQFVADVTEIDGARAGDEVVLLGKQGENEITAEEIADTCGTINYEVVCGISKRVPRVYTN